MSTEELGIKEITQRKELQPRDKLNKNHVHDLKDLIKEGKELPPVVIAELDGEYLLVDGFHRLEAYRLARVERVPVDIRTGLDWKAARLLAFRLNATHGLALEKHEKTRMVRELLHDPDYGEYSNRELARALGVSHTLVNNVRRKMREFETFRHPETRPATAAQKSRRGNTFELERERDYWKGECAKLQNQVKELTQKLSQTHQIRPESNKTHDRVPGHQPAPESPSQTNLDILGAARKLGIKLHFEGDRAKLPPEDFERIKDYLETNAE